MTMKPDPASAPSNAKPVTIHGWKCSKGPGCPTGGVNKRTFMGRFFADHAARNHGKQHRDCAATVTEAQQGQ